MKIFTISLFLIYLIFQNNIYPQPTDAFLGQTPPDNIPEIFAPGVVSTDAHEFSFCLSPDGEEIYFTRRLKETNKTFIMYSKITDSAWIPPEVAPFSVPFTFEAMITPDNKKLYYQAGRTVEETLHMFTMCVDRESDGWSEPIELGEPFSPDKTMYISSTLDGTIYTTDISEGMGNECLGMIELIEGAYSTMEKLPAQFNSEMICQYPWISPDGKYLLFSSSDPGEPMNSSLFISFFDGNGIWSEPRAIDLGMRASQPFVTYDGKYLFFSSGEPGNGDIYWVSTEVLK